MLKRDKIKKLKNKKIFVRVDNVQKMHFAKINQFVIWYGTGCVMRSNRHSRYAVAVIVDLDPCYESKSEICLAKDWA